MIDAFHFLQRITDIQLKNFHKLSCVQT